MLFAIPLAIYFLWLFLDLFFSLLVAFILMSALRPGVRYLVRKGFKRNSAALIVYFSFLLILVGILVVIVPPVIAESASFIKNLPIIVNKLTQSDYIKHLDQRQLNDATSQLINNASGLLQNVGKLVDVVSGFLSNTMSVLTTLVFGLYFLMEENIVEKLFKNFVPDSYVEKMQKFMCQAEDRMNAWFWGEITLMLVVGFLQFVGLSIVGVNYALPLAVLAGILEAMPGVGPIIAGLISGAIGFAQAPWIGVSALAVAVIVQQLENNLIVPFIMNKAVGINPITTLIVIIIGGRIGGVVGILLSVPIYVLVETAFLNLRAQNKK